jgi:hypothetical protein
MQIAHIFRKKALELAIMALSPSRDPCPNAEAGCKAARKAGCKAEQEHQQQKSHRSHP